MSVSSSRLVASLFAALTFGLPAVAAGAEEATGAVHGTLSAADGARLPFASVRLTDVTTGTTRVASTGELGGYRFAGLPAGLYDLEASSPGFAPSRVAGVEVGSGRDVRLDVVLEVAAVVESLVVAARRTGAGLEATQIAESGAKDVGEALSREPGLAKVRRAAIANDVVLRGLQSRDLNVLVDGERVYGACPNHMDPPAFHVDFAEVERIEVSSGPMDVRFQGSLGGLVNVVTRAPALGWHAQPTLVLGSFGYTNVAGTASFGHPRLSALAGASYRRSEPYADGDGRSFLAPANYRAGVDDSEAFRAGTAWGRVVWTPAEGQSLQASYTRQDASHVLYPYLQMDAIYDDTDRVGARFEQSSSGVVSGLRARGYWTGVSHWMTDEFRTTAAAAPLGYSMGSMADTSTVGGTLEVNVGPVLLGAESFRRRWNVETRLAGMKYAPQASIPDVAIDSVGAFAEYRRVVHARASVELGARIDRLHAAADAALANTDLYYAYHDTRTLERTDVLAGGKARVSWQPASSLDVAAGVGLAGRTADASERFFALRRMGSDWVGNPDLDPARNTGADVSVTWRLPGVTVTAAAFANWFDGYLTVYDQARVNPVPGVMNTRARSFANVDARTRGAEVRAEAVIASRLFVTADVNLLRGDQTPRADLGIESSVLAEMPPAMGHVRVRFDQGAMFLSAEATMAAAQDRVNTDLGERPTPGYGLLDLRGGWRYRWLTAAVGVTNLFDRTYSEHLSFQRDPYRLRVRINEPGRSVFANLTARF